MVIREQKVEAQQKLLFVKPPKINYTPRNKAKGKGGSVKITKNKKIVQEEATKIFVKNLKDVKKPKITNQPAKKEVDVLDRFLSKK